MAMSGPIPAGSPSVSASGLTVTFRRSSIEAFTLYGLRSIGTGVFDHGRFADFLQVGIGCGRVFFGIHLLADFPLLWRIDGRGLPRAKRHHLDTLLGHLWGRQVTDRGIIEHLPQIRRQIGGGLDHGFADRSIGQRLEISVRLIAALYAVAQAFGLLLPQLERARRGTVRNDQHNRLHPVFESVGLLLRLAAFGLYLFRHIPLADLEALLVPAAHQAAPDHVGLDAR